MSNQKGGATSGKDTVKISNRTVIVANIWKGKVWLHINQKHDKSVSMLVSEMSSLFKQKDRLVKAANFVKHRAEGGIKKKCSSSKGGGNGNAKRKNTSVNNKKLQGKKRKQKSAKDGDDTDPGTFTDLDETVTDEDEDMSAGDSDSDGS